MVDLISQHASIQEEIDAALRQVMTSARFIKGPEVQSFEEELSEYLGIEHVISCANGTDALQIAMMALGLQPGDEVITADFTYVATAEVIALLGLTPVLVDVDPKTFNIDAKAVEAAIGPKTKAIVPVHLFGQCADMEKINDLAKQYNLFVIEDTAQAINSRYHFSDGSKAVAGGIGHIGTTSFFPSKNLGCAGDGGAIFTRDAELAKKIRMIANHGQSRRYYHDMVGVNSRLDALQAAILRIKLRHLDKYIDARREAASAYDEAFEQSEKLTTPFRDSKSTHVFHQYTLQTHGIDRNGLQTFLKEANIPSMIYYPVPLHQQKAFISPLHEGKGFTVTNQLCDSVISLPMHTELDHKQIEYITSNVLAYLER